MQGLVFANRPDTDNQSTARQTLNSGSFYPEIKLSDARDLMRIDSNITDGRLFDALAEAIALVNSQLVGILTAAQTNGHTTLAQTRPEMGQINGQSTADYRYRRAVLSYTKALLLEKYADTDATGKTGTRAEAKQEQAQDYRRDGHFAIADLLRRRRCDAELI